MQVVRGLHNLRPRHRGCVATIGNFDGVHLGHQAVFRNLLARGRENGLPATVITFEPQPLEYFAPDAAPARLTRLREKLQALRDTGIERVVVLEFGPRLAAMDATEFVRHLLVEGLAAESLLVGDDFRFGRGRAGDYALLERMGREHGFVVENLNTVTHDSIRVSSTRIREALTAGDLVTAERLLGRPYRIAGRVRRGRKLGRSLGFPTANLALHRKVVPLWGIFAVRVSGAGLRDHPAVSSLGTRPTVNGTDPLLEVHLFDFDGDLYGHYLDVDFVARLRDEQKFDSIEALVAQMHRDAAAARRVLGSG